MDVKSLSDFLAYKPPYRRMVVGNGLLPAQQVMFIYGEYSTWKSWLAQDLAYAVSNGLPWLCWNTSKVNVLMIQTEISAGEYQLRWDAFIRNRGITVSSNSLYVDSSLDVKLDVSTCIGELKAAIGHYDIGLVIVDNLYSSTTGNISRNDDANIIISNVKMLAASTGVAFVIVHHARQGQMSITGEQIRQRGYEMFGSSFLTNWADTILEVTNEDVDKDVVLVTPQKHRLCVYKPVSASYQFNRNKLSFDIYV
mgnify:CR=1 FL=1